MSAVRVRRGKLSSSSRKSAVRVVARVRPFLSGEPQDDVVSVQQSNGDANRSELKLTERLKNSFGKTTVNEFIYKFNGCYDSSATQKEIFDNEIKMSIARAFEGFNTSVLAYGVTSSGKTYTMQGQPGDKGMIQRTMQCVLAKKKRMQKLNAKAHVTVSMQYCEIFKDKVWDLIEPKPKDLAVRESADGCIVVANLAKHSVENETQFQMLYNKGCNNRRTGATLLNHNSSRSHAIVMIHISYRETEKPFRLVRSKLHLIDLAGSEDNRITGNRGHRLAESGSINKSLFVLGNVINALNARQSRIPFRDAKITRLLQDSLGGDSFATLIINVAPLHKHFLMTYATLNFGSKSLNIHNDVVQNTVTELEQVCDLSPSSYRRRSDGAETIESETKAESGGCTGARRARGASLDEPKKRSRDCVEKRSTSMPNKRCKISSATSNSSIDVLESKADHIVSIGKQRLAKELILEAKTLRAAGKDIDALVLYRASAELLPDNERLAAKIAQIESRVDDGALRVREAENMRNQINAVLQSPQSLKHKKASSSVSVTANNCKKNYQQHSHITKQSCAALSMGTSKTTAVKLMLVHHLHHHHHHHGIMCC